MALSFGLKRTDVRESIWVGDPAIPQRPILDASGADTGRTGPDVPQAALQSWRKDGDASHLEQYAKAGKPTRIVFRNLKLDEAEFVKALVEFEEPASLARAIVYCFRLGVDIPDLGPHLPDNGSGARRPRVVREHGYPMMALDLADGLNASYPGIVEFYGGLIFNALWPSEPEKKASLPPVTPPPCETAASTVDPSTAGTPEAA